MGLDQSLYVTTATPEEIEAINLFNRAWKEDENASWDDFKTYEKEEVVYWRKSNQIHKWFVDNVQGGIDDCGHYVVKKEKVVELINLCGKVLYKPSLADSLLPTQSGFFFGGTGYDAGYLEDVAFTQIELSKILEEYDFENETLVYHSSW